MIKPLVLTIWGIAEYNIQFKQYIQKQYGITIWDQYEQFAKENETNHQLRSELSDRHTEFINIAVFLLAKRKETPKQEDLESVSPDESDIAAKRQFSEKKPKYGSVSIKGMKADFEYAEPDKAIPVVKAATFLQPHDADNWCILGNLYIEKESWKSAIACYDKALSINPKSSRAMFWKEKAENMVGES